MEFAAQDPDFDARVRESFARQRVMSLLGARIEALAPGRCAIAWPFEIAVFCWPTGMVQVLNSTVSDGYHGLLGWISFGYGLYATAVEPTLTHDDAQIAVGAEAVLLAVLSFLWARQRRSLGWALVLSGLAAPVAMYATAPLYWDPRDVTLFDSEAFWTTVGVGSAAGIPLIALGVYTLVRARPAPARPDPVWFTPVRWILQAGLIIIVIAFRRMEKAKRS